MAKSILQKLQQSSFHASFLWKTAAIIIVCGTGLGFVFFSFLPDGEQLEEDSGMSQGHSMAGLPGQQLRLVGSFPDQLSQLVTLYEYPEFGDPWVAIQESGFAAQQMKLASLLLQNLQAQGDELNEDFKSLLVKTPGEPWANYAAGLYWQQRGYYYRAGKAFEIEGERPEARIARESAVFAFMILGDIEELTRLKSKGSEYANMITGNWARIHLEHSIESKDWNGILRWLTPAMYESIPLDIIVITIITGLAWLAFLFHLGFLWKDYERQLICAFAVLMGALSTWPTILISIWQTDFLGLSDGTDTVTIFLSNIAGVGLREEAMKLLFFVPCLPFLLKKKDSIFALIVACCVGLGFAAEENLNYFFGSNALSGPGRFLTANFLHISATGLTGFALYQAVLDRGRSLSNLATVFGLVVIAHGLYNALMSIPEHPDLSFFSMTVYIVLCLQLFRVLNYYGAGRRYAVSLSWVFTTVLSIVLASVICLQVSQWGFSDGIRLLVPSILGVAALVIVFFRIFNEQIVT